MKKVIVSMILVSTLLTKSIGQINKGNWMIGGTISFSSTDNSGTAVVNYKQNDFLISGRIGHFFLNKTAVGIIPGFRTNKVKGLTQDNTYNFLSIGPYIRQYLLSTDKNVNVFAEIGYTFENTNINGSPASKANTILSKFGVCYFLNSSVSLEMGMEYNQTKYREQNSTNIKVLNISVGFQLHLEKK